MSYIGKKTSRALKISRLECSRFMVFPKELTHKFCLKIEILVKRNIAIVFTEVRHQDLHD